MALEVFTGTDRFERLADASGREQLTDDARRRARGRARARRTARERTRRYRPAAVEASARDVRVLVDIDASSFATVVEVHAPDDVGLLARVAAVFVDLELDVAQAIVSTSGDRVVDVFYLRDGIRQKFTDPLAVDSLRATLLARLTSEVTLD